MYAIKYRQYIMLWKPAVIAWLACELLSTFPNTWWRHKMETFSAWLVICAGNSPVTGEFPSQRPVTRSLDVFFDLRLNKRLGKLVGAGDLKRHRAHYDVTVMITRITSLGNRKIAPVPVFMNDMGDICRSWSTSSGQVRLGGSVRNCFSVRTILNSTGNCKLPR